MRTLIRIAGVAIVVLALTSVSRVSAQIMPYPENPCYWQLDGVPTLLVGGSGDDNLFQWVGDHFGDRLTRHLDLLVSVGGNYVRNAMNSRYDAVNGYNDTHMAYPFKRLASGLYDLDAWNPDYWHRLDVFLRETRRRGIVVQLELWDRDTMVGKDPWAQQPWNPDNNVNFSYAQTSLSRGKNGNQLPFFEAVLDEKGDALLKEYQDRYIQKILETTLAYDHVLYQINNESPLVFPVSDYWAALVHREAALVGRSVHVCDSRRFHRPSPYVTTEFQDWRNPDVHHPILHSDLYTFCDVSQNGGNIGEKHYDNLIWYRSRLMEHSPRPINHVKVYTFIWPTGTSWFDRIEFKQDGHARRRFWRSILGGSGAVRHHRDKGNWGLGLTSKAQSDIRSARMLADVANLFAMEPAATSLLSARAEDEAYAMLEPGKQLVVYFTGKADRSVEVDLHNIKGTLVRRWLDVDNCIWPEEITIEGGRPHRLSAPDHRQWIAVITQVPNGDSL